MRLPQTPLFYRLKDLSKVIGIPAKTLASYCASGRLAHTKRGASEDSRRPTIYVPREAAERLINEMAADVRHPARPEPPPSRVRPLTLAPRRGRPRKSA